MEEKLPTRKQYANDTHTGRTYLIDCNQGKSEEVDGSGLNIKTYHTTFTGVVGSSQRKARAKVLSDRAMMPEIHLKVNIGKEMIPDILNRS
jgi:hypothetical protein